MFHEASIRYLAKLIIGLAISVSIASILLRPLAGLTPSAQATAGIGLLMAVFWITEVIPLVVTALLPLILFPLAGISTINSLGSSYAHPIIFLFLGGFLIARAIERWNLHRRLAFAVLVRTTNKPKQVVLSVMSVTAFLSLWISNTAATMVMVPIAASIAAMNRHDDGFAPALLLGVAYSATIGGMGSLIGTPPNALFAAYMEETHGLVISFVDWFLVGLPVVSILLPLSWFWLTRFSFKFTTDPIVYNLETPGGMSSSEIRVSIVAVFTALGLILRPVIGNVFPELLISDASIAMAGAIALFTIPAGGGNEGKLLDWETAASLRWDILILFGGGLALASTIESTGLAIWIGNHLQVLEDLPAIGIFLLMAFIVVYLGELASNTAMAAIFIPIAGAAAVGMGADPLSSAIPIALAASIGFMLPVATPPNAIVFAYPAVTRARMLRAGAPLDIIGVFIAVAIGALLGPFINVTQQTLW